jgi:hypothetical protein
MRRGLSRPKANMRVPAVKNAPVNTISQKPGKCTCGVEMIKVN